MRLVLAGGGLGVCGFWWFDPLTTPLDSPGAVLTAAGRVAGLVGAYLALVQLLLLARLPWLERAVGFDRLAAWHRGLGTNVVLVIVAHVLLVTTGLGATERHAPWSAILEIVTTYPDMLTALAGMALFLLVATTSAYLIRRRLSYETWYVVHLSAYLAVALAFFHQLSSGGDFVTNPIARALWIGGYAIVAATLVWWRLILPIRQWFRHAITIERVVRETPDAVSIWLRGRRLTELDALPGQFLLWRFVTVGHLWTAHPYSLSAPVGEHRMRITVKDAGDHSGAAAHLHRGVPVFAEGPFGHFTADRRVLDPVLLISGGSGIAPIRALAEQLLRERTDVVLVHRASAWHDIPLRAELDAMAHDGLLVHYLVGRRRELRQDPLAPGPLFHLVPDVRQRSVYVCGPEGMTATVLSSLRRFGIPPRQIHTEEFTLR
ncbi:MAG TPA: ferredoxin reductase family protein [Pseudonocardiaceae bacterium]